MRTTARSLTVESSTDCTPSVRGLAQIPALLAFQSLLDSTVSTRAVVRTLFAHLPANGSELVLFDINRNARLGPLLRRSTNGRVIGLTSAVAENPRAYWGAYAASKAALEVLLDCYAQETRNISKVRVAIVNPGATRTAMRAKAYPGEDPASVKPPEAVAARLVTLLGEQFESGHRESVNQ